MKHVIGRLDDFLLDFGKLAASASERAQALRRLEAATAWVENHCYRSFASKVESRIYRGVNGAQLAIPGGDLAVVTAIEADAAGGDSWATALVVDDDYTLEPRSELLPYWRVAFTAAQTDIRIRGNWGWFATTETLGVTVQGGGINASATAITTSAAHGLCEGEVIVIESEQLYVADVPTNVTLTVERGVHGTTAASHAAGVTVYRRMYPPAIVEAVYFQAVRSLRSLQTGGAQMAGGSQFGQPMGSDWPMIRDALAYYRWLSF